MATITYNVMESAPWHPIVDITLIRIIDRTDVLISTNLGCVYISRTDAARALREARRRKHHPFVSTRGNATSTSIKKTITP